MKTNASESVRELNTPKPELLKVDELIAQFKGVYQQLNRDTLDRALLASVYEEQMHFEDSFHVIDSLDAFQRYCANLYENVSDIRFRFHDHWLQDGQAMLTWTMQYAHPKLNRGKAIYVDGASHLRFRERIYFHKDYFDGGQLLYEQVPLLGGAIRFLKDRMV